MTDPTDDELDRWLAEKVMGWHLEPNEHGTQLWYDRNEWTSYTCGGAFDDWRPSRDANQAEECRIKAKVHVDAHSIETDGQPGWAVRPSRYNGPSVYDLTLARALALAVMRAVQERETTQ